jgi:hypothetical protein
VAIDSSTMFETPSAVMRASSRGDDECVGIAEFDRSESTRRSSVVATGNSEFLLVVESGNGSRKSKVCFSFSTAFAREN